MSAARSNDRSVSAESRGNSPAPDNDQASEEKRARVDYFPASRLFEYLWPQDGDGGDFYILQEQVKEFLDIRRIQRIYPGKGLAYKGYILVRAY